MFTAAILGVSLLVGVGFAALRILRLSGCCRDCMQEAVKLAADTDKSGTTTEEEWRAVYQELGLAFRAADAQRLTVQEMDTYLSQHWPPKP